MSKPGDWENLKEQLREVLQTDVVWGNADEPPDAFVVSGHAAYFLPLISEPYGLWIKGPVTARERQLIRLLRDSYAEQNSETSVTEVALVRWLRDVDRERHIPPLPPALRRLDLGERVPFYIVCDEAVGTSLTNEFNRVLQPFFAGHCIVISLAPGELFILPEAAQVFQDGEESDWKDGLISWGGSFIDLCTSELGMEVDVVVHPSVDRLLQWGSAWLAMKEAYCLGKGVYPSRRVFATWQMTLARLLSAVPQQVWDAVREDIASYGHDWWRNLEMRATVSTYFQMNLNVSETARRLYIHRNTLLYRLEKIKQETGRDVRQFEDAVLVYLALLVTERELQKD